MASREEWAQTLLHRALAVIDQTQYFDVAPEKPEITERGYAYTIKLLIHLRVHEAERLLTKGPLWSVAAEHPYIKIEEVWSGDQHLIRYIYELVDLSFGITEGFHFHVETDTHGQSVSHYTRKEQGKKPIWKQLEQPTALERALNAFVETIWQLRS